MMGISIVHPGKVGREFFMTASAGIVSRENPLRRVSPARCWSVMIMTMFGRRSGAAVTDGRAASAALVPDDQGRARGAGHLLCLHRLHRFEGEELCRHDDVGIYVVPELPYASGHSLFGASARAPGL